MTWQIIHPHEIEKESFRRIEAQVRPHHLPPEEWTVARRMIHTTGDFEYLDNVRFHPRAVAAGLEALGRGRPIVTDTRMLASGIGTGRLQRLGVEVICLMDDPEVARLAKERGTTRAAGGHGADAAPGRRGYCRRGERPHRAPRLIDLLAAGAAPPALIVGVPVGFVNAAESKEALTHLDCPFITSLGPKGGSAVAASIINALAIMALAEKPI